MPIMPWSDLLSVGVASIDQQHRILVGILNQLGDSLEAGIDAWDESVALTRLVDYTESHFAFEEELMRRAGYPGLDAHEQEHRLLFQQVAELMARSSSGEKVGTQALLVFLRDWLTSHIMGTDRALGLSLNRMGMH
ncbi:MAG: hemerythrin family protein [Burkholderiales bacterium]|nr:hemerythrin family protein [Burkholderiales bacterium]MDE2454240.1 hemerythrin family protein [Burkholderiales bacterium]